jgi:hypothetical protein
MPQNCSSDVEAVISYLDGMYAANNTAGIQTLKEAFGMGDIVHVDDFATARESPVSFIFNSAEYGQRDSSRFAQLLIYGTSIVLAFVLRTCTSFIRRRSFHDSAYPC